jgi:hypothetical protein
MKLTLGRAGEKRNMFRVLPRKEELPASKWRAIPHQNRNL